MHAHIHTRSLDFVALSRRIKMRMINMAVNEGDDTESELRHQTTFAQSKAAPDQIAPVVSFSMKAWDSPDWQRDTIRFLDDCVDRGAIGVKVWKNIGMDARDRDGKLVMIDHPRFTPIFRHIKKRGLVLLAHLGEPKNCWLPLDRMTTNGDRSYFMENPQYHMYRHPEMPSYQDQIDVRDRMLAKNPGIRFVGTHLGSQEWSLEAMSDFLERFPAATLGCAARVGHLQHLSMLDREAVIQFLSRYQDRIMYGSDVYVGPKDLANEAFEKADSNWRKDWRYFCTDDMIEVYDHDQPVKGLALPKQIIDKLFRENATRVFTGAWGR